MRELTLAGPDCVAHVGAMAKEHLSPVDAAWLRMDSEANPMVITAMLQLDGPLDHTGEKDLVDRLLAHPRFHRRPVGPALGVGTWHWEDAPKFDPESHVHRIALPAPGDDAALASLVSDLMSTKLDHARPLWQLHIVELPKGTALIARVHHAMGDGVALVSLLLAITGIDIKPEEVGLLAGTPVTNAAELARRSGEQALALGKLLLLPGDAPTPLKGTQSSRKRAAWSKAYPLDAIKSAAHGLDAKANDLLLASVTAGLRAYLDHRDAMRDGLEVHAIVPVFFRGAEGLGNHFGLVFAALPLGSSDPHDRVRAVKLRMDRIKATPEAQVAFAILAATGVASAEIESIVIDIFSRKASVMVTNIPGPPVPLVMAGRNLERILVWAPTAGHVALGISLLSYAGAMHLTVAADAALVPDPERIVAGFERDLDALLG